MLRALPLRQRHPAAYLAKHPMSGFAEAFRVLRAALVYGPHDEPRKVVAVTSALPGEGKTTSSLCLARIAAMSGERVMLIDCDFRRRGLNNLLDITPEFGLLEVLNGERRWQAACGVDEASGAHVLPIRPADFSTRDIIGSPAMRALIDDLRAHYDMIVLDCAPVLALAETRAAAALADTVVVVGSWRKTSAHALAAALNHLDAAGAQVAGVALNRIDMNAPGRTSYHDTLYYSDVHKAYYHA
jgi:capsular exopolysaccharide synthesis family protein